MSRSQGQKRKQPDINPPAQSLTEHERILYDVIRSKTDMGIWTADMKREVRLPESVFKKSMKALQAKNLIKEVANIQNKGKKHYMATEYEPSKELTGGDWYADGKLDIEFIKLLKQLCKKQISDLNLRKVATQEEVTDNMNLRKVATLEEVTDNIRKSGAFETEIPKQQIEEIVRALVLDNEVIEVQSNGMGEFSGVQIGKVCYKCISKGNNGGEPKVRAMASIPCGVCPRISQCTPDGIISPQTCVYYTKWLEF